MVLVDTNILVYAAIEQDLGKKETSISILKNLADKSLLLLSPLIMQEYVFTLSKLKIDNEVIWSDILFYQNFSNFCIDNDIFMSAFKECNRLNCCKNINDIIHLKFAERYATKLITFDGDFEKFKSGAKIEIEILR